MSVTTKKKEKVKFSKAFWVANTVELLERAAYYGVFVVITLYLSNVLGFTDIQAATIAGVFSACLYLLPTFSGALADKIGFRKSMLLAFTLLSLGYLGLGLFPNFLASTGLVEYGYVTKFTGLQESGYRYGIIPIMILIIVGECNFRYSGQRDGREKPGERICYFLRDGKYRSFLRKGSCHPVA